jgi:hypothetical protein
MTKDLEKKYQKLNKERRYELLNKKGDEFKSKLQTYSIVLIDHLNWEIRDQYLELLDEFIDKKIDSLNFRITFCERYESIDKVADLLKSNLVLLSPDKNSLNFGDLLAEIDNYCKAYSDDPEPFRNKFEIGDVEFRISIEKIYLKIQK